jgi:hypothetical protein
MNYPVWEVPYWGGGMLIGIIAIAHVFIAHFAVGGGLFLPLTERMIDHALQRLHRLRGFMPPFLGTEAERKALAKWLAELAQQEAWERDGKAKAREVAP